MIKKLALSLFALGLIAVYSPEVWGGTCGNDGSKCRNNDTCMTTQSCPTAYWLEGRR